MKKLLSITAVLAVTAAFNVGCSSDDNTNPAPEDSGTTSDSVATTDSGKPDTATTDSGAGDTPTDTPSDTPGFPTPPTLGAQIDRMGRPAINTAANHSFDTNSATKNAAKDGYNQDKDPTHWATYVPEFQKNLAILDALDGTCGNQLAYKGTTPAADSYSPLAGLLAGDMLWLNTAATTCTLDGSPDVPKGFLAVEAKAVLTLDNDDCGGRALSYDVMNRSYQILAAGAAGLGLGPLDGVTAVPDRSKGKTFPYLAAPHP